MGISRAVASLAVLCAMASCVHGKTAGARTSPALKDAGDDYCATCVVGSFLEASKLIRGSDEVTFCEDGYYCDCEKKEKLRCRHTQFKLNPDAFPARCTSTFDCKKWFDANPMPTNQPPTGQPPTGQPPTGQPPTGQPPTGQPPTGQTPTGQTPTPSPVNTTPSPSSASPSPVNPSPSPSSASPSPVNPSPSPASPTSSPVNPSPSTASPTPSPVNPSPSPAIRTPSPITPSPWSVRCSSDVADVMLRDPADCSRYIRCSYGRSWNMPCAPGTFFSFARQGCVFFRDSDCLQET